VKQTGSGIWLTLIVGLLAGACIFFFLFGGLAGGFITMFVDFNAGFFGGAAMLGFGVVLILSLILVITIYLRAHRNK